MKSDLLAIHNLKVSYFTWDTEVRAVDGVTFKVSKGEVVALVGESGSGKTTTALAIPRLILSPAKIIGGQVLYKKDDLLQIPNESIQKLRGNEIAMIFQDPATYLNPLMKVGAQISEAILLHEEGVNKEMAKRRTIEILRLVRIPDPERVIDYYPHQLSGGMAQRVGISIAIAHHPSLLIADEPTTALDLTVQSQILNLLRTLNRELNLAMMLITHDLGIVAGVADRVIVMYAGHLMEEGQVNTIFKDPKHPYTQALLAASRYTGEKTTEQLISGSSPDLSNLPPGCTFHPRCPRAFARCQTERPQMIQFTNERRIACWLYDSEQDETP